ncbi:MAG: hypothetical protein ACYDDS_12500 [Candidatus Sulfotelmatobacter sp.]
MQLRRMAWIFSVWFLFLFSGSALAQGRPSSAPPVRADPIGATTTADESERRMARDMAKKANLERQAQLKTDTEKLLKLSQELKDYVDKSNENMLSLDVLRKAEEIEKLAKSVKDKMKGPN